VLLLALFQPFMKTLLRNQLKSQLRSLSPAQKLRAESLWLQSFCSKFKNVKSIALYYPMSYEPNVIPLINYCWTEDIQVILPVISENSMAWKQYLPNTLLLKSSLGFLEPSNTQDVPLSTLSAIVVPFLGLNSQGCRLGHGKGFYDRALQNYQGLTLGYGFDFQQVEFEAEPWDIALDDFLLISVE
jgi:5-formyltetrahydrofolate cyclo-ligase